MKTKHAWWAAGLALVVLAGWRVSHCGAPLVADDPNLIDERFWIEDKSNDPKRYLHAAFFVTEEEFGVFSRGSRYDVHLEVCELTRDKNDVRIVFPQSGKKAQFRFDVKKCDEKKPFDLCLDVSANPWGGPRRYYGFMNRDDEARELGDVAREARARAHAPL